MSAGRLARRSRSSSVATPSQTRVPAGRKGHPASAAFPVALCLVLLSPSFLSSGGLASAADHAPSEGNAPGENAASDGDGKTHPAPDHEIDFTEASPGAVPREIFVADGDWRLALEDDLVALEHVPLPLADGEVQFGPSLRGRGARIEVETEVPRRKRSHSQAAIGLHGVSGYRLRLHRAARRIELVKAWQVVAEAPLPETDEDRWILELEVAPDSGQSVLETPRPGSEDAEGGTVGNGIDSPPDPNLSNGRQAGGWSVLARAWPASAPRPESPQLRFEGAPEALSGRATLRSAPFSGKPVRFFRLRIWELQEAPDG